MDIREELSKIDFKIQELEQEKLAIKRKFISDQCERDIKTFAKYYDKLMSIYNNKHPELYDKIIVNCFPIRTIICCGFCGSAKRITLSTSDPIKIFPVLIPKSSVSPFISLI